MSLLSASAFVVPIASAAPAHAAPAPQVAAPTGLALSAPIDPDQSATEFFDDVNAARADAGLPALAWRADVATMAVAHSVEMAQQGTIWHGSFVTDGTLKSLNASSLGENVGMGGATAQVHDAFMNSPHHRDNILDAGFNQVGIGVIVAGSTLFVTEDFMQARAPAVPRPTPVAHPAVKKPAPAPAPSRVAAAPKRSAPTPTTPPPTAPPPTAPPVTAPPVTAPPTTAFAGVVIAVPLDTVPVAAPLPAARGARSDGSSLVWAALLGAVLLAGSAGGHVAARRRRQT